jgi:diadenosine tetraphosphate (Ap4A) HIT family hydrolase
VIDRLWAGWRTAYVSGGVEIPAGEGSLFERILGSGLPDEETWVVWRGRRCAALLNAFPYTSGHLMVMPYRAVPFLDELDAEESAELWATVEQAVVALRSAYSPEGVNIGANLGLAAGAGVPDHLHVHVLPRWSGDTNFMTSVAETRVLPEALGESWRRLRAAWSESGERAGPQ